MEGATSSAVRPSRPSVRPSRIYVYANIRVLRSIPVPERGGEGESRNKMICF